MRGRERAGARVCSAQGRPFCGARHRVLYIALPVSARPDGRRERGSALHRGGLSSALRTLLPARAAPIRAPHSSARRTYPRAALIRAPHLSARRTYPRAALIRAPHFSARRTYPHCLCSRTAGRPRRAARSRSPDPPLAALFDTPPPPPTPRGQVGRAAAGLLVRLPRLRPGAPPPRPLPPHPTTHPPTFAPFAPFAPLVLSVGAGESQNGAAVLRPGAPPPPTSLPPLPCRADARRARACARSGVCMRACFFV